VCGEAVAAVPDGLPAGASLTKRQAAVWFPALAEALAEHDVVCASRRDPPAWSVNGGPPGLLLVAIDRLMGGRAGVL
jgi:hypothetical protein